MHTAELVAPILCEAVPGGQGRHIAELVAPVLLEYVPAGHVRSSFDPVQYLPAGQVTLHADNDVAAVPEVVLPAGQFLHEVL